MDEALEMLFVDQGTYKVGYEINKKRFMKLMFGESTIIGGFQLCYEKRFMFLYIASSYLTGQSIRKENFISIMKEFPEFKHQIKSKVWTFYSQEIYRPLNKLKNYDI